MGDATVLLRKGALGDVILLGAVTAAIPGRVTVVTAPAYVDLAARLVGVHAALPWSTRLPPGRAVDLQGGSRGLRRAPLATRIRKRTLRRLVRLWTGLGAPRPDVPHLYAEAVGVEPVAPPWIAGATGGPGLAVIPGASSPFKRWSVERFAAVGRAWNGPVTVFGGPGEDGLVGPVADAIPGADVVLERGFELTIEALGRCRLAVANDSGLMHLAGALGLPVVAIFGPTHPDDGFFVYPGAVVQRTDLACRPCSLHQPRVCRTGDRRCLDVGVDAVIEAVRRCAG